MKIKIFDRTIFSNALSNSVKNLTSIISFSILLIANIVIGATLFSNSVTFSFAQAFIFIFIVLSLGIFNIMNLNLIYLNDTDHGVLNLEMRKGKKDSAIFFSRLLCNKLISTSIIFIHIIFVVIFCAAKNTSQINNFPLLFLLLIPIDWLLTGLLLLCFAFSKHKLALILTTILTITILPAPMLGWLAGAFIQEKTAWNLDSEKTTAVVARNKVIEFEQSNEQSEKNLVQEILKEGYLFNNILSSQNSDYVELKNIQILANGILELQDLDQVARKLTPTLNYNAKSSLEISEAVSETLIAKTNAAIIKDAEVNDLSTNYLNSIYSDKFFTNSQYSFTIKEFKKVIKEINEITPEPYQKQMIEFNKLVYDFGINLIVNNRSQEFPFNVKLINNGYYSNISDVQEFWFAFADVAESKDFNTPVGLRLWNQSMFQLVKNALGDYGQPREKANITKINNYNFFYPWAITYEIILNPNQFISDFQVLKNTQTEFTPLSTFLVNTGSKYLNDISAVTPGSDTNNIEKFTEWKMVNKSFGGKYIFFNKLVYEFVLFIFGIAIVGISYLIFSKRLRP